MFIAKWMLSKLVHTNSYKNVHAINESVDGHMTACHDEIGRRTTTQQPTNERWSGGSGSGGGGSLAAAQQQQQHGGGTQRDGGSEVAAVRRLRQRPQRSGGTPPRWRQAMDGATARATARATAINGAGQEGGTTTERGNATTSWVRGTSMIQFLSCDTNLCELVYTNL